MKAVRPVRQVVIAGVAILVPALSGLGCFSPLLAGIGGGTTLYQHETAKSSGDANGSTASSKAKSKQSSRANADDSNLE
jgi:hypothetical protein